ncbi:hypothetical protein [Nostoc sp. TCL26-01]|uniref:hypothetical protein n=1 Tax=Nostoc sp. TCL26-01 TaxID=2576904 RepID=UPI0015BA9C78|nr:hypothetical protein [Nostoc sp. TCL26-01]QLE59756.1 hypothetical protein FD725_30390 [Nostoc sp. TCL26-01]
MKLDSRDFSKKAYTALESFKDKKDQKSNKDNKTYLEKKYHKKASGLIQGLPAYISTWGLHRLSGDAKKFLNGTAEDTTYKGKVYQKFLHSLKEFSEKHNFNPDDEKTLIRMPLREYTGLNHLAIQFAKEWSFWAAAVLGEAEDS